MDAGTAAGGNGKSNVTRIPRTRKTGRQDGGKQEAVMSRTELAKHEEELLALHKKAVTAADNLSDGITKAAKASGFLASAVKRLIKAKAGDDYEEKRREVRQLSLLFDVDDHKLI